MGLAKYLYSYWKYLYGPGKISVFVFVFEILLWALPNPTAATKIVKRADSVFARSADQQ